jgi:hypothetical protein
VLLGLSVYPGVLVDLLFLVVLFSPLWLSVVIIGGVTFLTVQVRNFGKKSVSPDLDLIGDDIGGSKEVLYPRRWIILSPAIVALSLVLILTGIPKRVAFILSRPAFQRHIARAPVSEDQGEPLGRMLGVYYVDRYAADPRGGVYLRTHAGPDGIGPDTISYGFAFRPNREGTPFGRARYHRSHMVGDWYLFWASNDY